MMSSSSAEAERQPILGVPSDSPSQEPIWREKKDRKTTKIVVGAFLGFVILNLILSILMASIQSAKVNKLYILLLASLLAFSQVQFFVVFFIYKEYVAQKHFYAVFVIGIAVIIECITTDILVFTVDHK